MPLRRATKFLKNVCEKEELGGLLGPTSLAARGVPGLGLSVASGTADVTSKRNDFFLLADVLEELGCAPERHSFNGFSGLARVLVVHAQVGAARLDRLSGIFGLSGITRHCVVLTETNPSENLNKLKLL